MPAARFGIEPVWSKGIDTLVGQAGFGPARAWLGLLTPLPLRRRQCSDAICQQSIDQQGQGEETQANSVQD